MDKAVLTYSKARTMERLKKDLDDPASTLTAEEKATLMQLLQQIGQDDTSNWRDLLAKTQAQLRQRPKECALCGKKEDPQQEVKLLGCGQCLVIFYCSKEHQKDDWPRHKSICKKLAEKKK